MKKMLTLLTALLMMQFSVYAQFTSNVTVNSANGGIFIQNVGSNNYLMVGGYNITSSTGFLFRSTTNTTATQQFSLLVTNGTTQVERMTITRDGNVGIGTTLTYNPNNYKLAVKGTIGAQAIRVENTSTTWSDYVFEKDYKLRSLFDVEQFIQSNGHLPDVPSAKQVEKEGIELFEMDATLLRKIEELTLYMIEQNKQLQELNKKLQDLNKENALLKNKVSNLQNK